ncbi:helix-turn-helix transcriptional regulator [Amnibacterium setariae]|uniref:LuxR family transcriptional regulator n=1 Tax=Amnibacterium setariae TaxID=2306585 RepID=A0A3A1U412_9MICO|nr:helix-turn-helix transcriptional regulator [Amnibacterium setariae]RIX28587.1 LuxR family transcriptional regulator [Amnibacterium setariae]
MPTSDDRLDPAALDPGVLTAVQTVAALDRVPVRDAPALLGGAARHVDAAVRAGLLVLEDGALRPADRDVAAQALGALPEDDRRALHRRLAAAGLPPAQAARQRDLAEPVGLDETLARELERAAFDAERAGAVGVALDLWTRAAARSGDDRRARIRRELRLAAQAHVAGRSEQAATVLEALDWPALDRDEAEQAADLLISAAYKSSGQSATRQRLERVHDALPADHPNREVTAVYLAGIGEHFGEVRARLERALPELRSDRFSPGFQRAALSRLLYATLLTGGGFDEGLLAELGALEAQVPDLLLEDTVASKRAMYAHVADRVEESDRAIAALLVEARVAGDAVLTRTLLVHAAQVDVLLGRFASAARRLEERAALSGDVHATPAALRAAGLLALERGDFDEVVRAVGSTPSDTASMGRIARSALQGLLLARTGSPAAAIPHLEDAVDTAERIGVREPGRRLWVDVDLARARVLQGDVDRAGAIAASIRRLGEGTTRRLPALQADRIEAWIADARDRPRDRADRALAVLRASSAMEWVPERARVSSEVLHLLRDADLDEETRSEVTSTARSALGLIEDGTARRALAADLERWEEADLRLLTPAERRVTDGVVAGLSNKEVAERLHLSIRTVESHLRSIFVKLDVPSRSRLVARFARSQG